MNFDFIKKLFQKKNNLDDLAAFASYEDPILVDDPVRESYIKQQEGKPAPWAMFEVIGIDEGQVKIHMSWNPTFIKYIQALGFAAETEEDTVQLFFRASQMQPKTQDSTVQNPDLPAL
jgi:hypothetical protein